MGLSEYHKKRDFNKTPEPKGRVVQDTSHLFIIQKHAASHLHYDFRIELDGVLKSWAVPKGPSLDPKIKRLAMHVEDHPIEYGTFEGIIPKEQYGGGTVMLWDKGCWIPLDKNPKTAYKNGHLRFELKAEKLKGRWDLIRFKDEKHWFLIKHQDDFSRSQTEYDITKELDKSVLSHQSIAEIATLYKQVWTSKGLKKRCPALPANPSKSAFPETIKPQLATLVNAPPEGSQWLHEVKFDGYRILAYKKKGQVELKSRDNLDWTEQLKSIAMALIELASNNFILDGEVVVLDKEGRTDFQLLQNSIHDKTHAQLHYYVFDILYYDAFNLTELPLLDRKILLKKILDPHAKVLHFSEHLLSNGSEMFEHSCKLALEGIVSKRIDSPYRSGRNKDWLKTKCVKRQEFVIGGYTLPKGERDYFGSLLLGVYNSNNELQYVGNVGTGFSRKTLKEIYKQLTELETKTNPFITKPINYPRAHWVHPKLLAEIEFASWTLDGHIRHASFKGLRFDKKANDIVRDQEESLDAIRTPPLPPEKKPAKLTSMLSHPDKILYPEDKISKEELLLYYEAVSKYMLPFIKLRPLTLVRCPVDYEKCFYQRHYDVSQKKTLFPIEIAHGDKLDNYIYLKDKKGLLSLVQMGVLEIHPWGSTIKHIEQPDVLIFDLDPAPGIAWSKVVASAFEVRDYLAQYQLTSFVKTTGGKGLHVVVPIKPEYDWEAIKEFTLIFAQFLEKLKPTEYLSTMSKAKRKGKIFVDYLRNQRTATVIAPYSTRARIHAPVSTPLAWNELSDRIEDNIYTIRTLPERLSSLKMDPWTDFWKIKQSLRLDEL